MVAPSRGTVLVGLGALLFVGTLVASAALAPAIGVDDGRSDRTLVGIQGGGPGWHEDGSVVLLQGSNATWREASADSYFDVTWRPDGTVLAGFMHGGSADCGLYRAPCARTGFRVIDPEPSPLAVDGYSFPVRSQRNSEVHDVEVLPSGQYLVTDMDAERIVAVTAAGDETWEWRAAGFYEAPPDPTRTDWLHVNDVDVIAEDRYLVSVRNANQLLVIDRDEGVVEVINADRDESDDGSCRRTGQLVDTDGDGDVRCGDPDVLDHQHNPQWLGDGAVLVADSDNDRVVELHRTAAGDWMVAWTLERAGGVALNWPRDADRLANGHTLVTDTLNRRIVEVDDGGAVVWSYETAKIPYEADRVPDGELVGAPRVGGTPIEDTTPGADVPVLSDLLVLLRAVLPGLPFWFTEVQMLATLFSLGLIGAGVVDRYRR